MKLFFARLRNRWIRLRLRNRKLDSMARSNLKALDHLDPSRPAKSYRYVVVDVETTGVDLQNLVVDTEKLCREIIFLPFLLPSRAARYQTDYSLDAIADHFGIEIQDRHTAMGDALATAMIFQRILARLNKGLDPVHCLVRTGYHF